MKTLTTFKTITILTLVAGLTLGPVSSAVAFPKSGKWGELERSTDLPNLSKDTDYQVPDSLKCPPFCSPLPPTDAPSDPIDQPSAPTQDNNHDHSRGVAWGPMVGGTILGIVLSSMANQSKQETQQQVEVVQQPADDATAQQLAEEIERERQKSLALEKEIARLKAASKTKRDHKDNSKMESAVAPSTMESAVYLAA
jgi:hypothetical protein